MRFPESTGRTEQRGPGLKQEGAERGHERKVSHKQSEEKRGEYPNCRFPGF